VVLPLISVVGLVIDYVRHVRWRSFDLWTYHDARTPRAGV